ncbi:decapping nuclease DXO homolog [Teleopsis dalmanni]|uniref:decapping nuclease DXO homolog n=1 Tax=Teleopsis dalmanni TaxID=139649 RepID=UPI0018CDD65C|nr:decapping nuclease DXO homolog [Teleopsis dalmanni]
MSEFKEFLILNSDDRTQIDKSTYIKKPEIVDIMMRISFNSDYITPPNLKYFKEPKVPLNLNEGFETYIFRNQNFYKKPMKQIEKYVLDNGITVLNTAHQGNTQICCRRSVLDAIMKTPYLYGKSFEWTIYATKFDNVIYLTNHDTYKQFRRVTDSHHFKFRQFCLSDAPKKAIVSDTPIDENIQTYCIYRTTLKSFDLIYSAEVVGIISDTEVKDLKNMTELNACRFIWMRLTTPYGPTKEKYLHWWLQCYLANVSTMYVGCKTRHGIINEKPNWVNPYKIAKSNSWNINVGTTFLEKFLRNIKEKMSSVDCPYTVYEFRLEGANNLIKYKVHNGKSNFSFLTERYINEFLCQKLEKTL